MKNLIYSIRIWRLKSRARENVNTYFAVIRAIVGVDYTIKDTEWVEKYHPTLSRYRRRARRMIGIIKKLKN